MKLTTKRLILLPVRMADAGSFYEHAKYPEVSLYAGFPSPKSIASTRKRILKELKEWKKPGVNRTLFSVFRKGDNAWVGGINLRWPHAGVGELGYSVHPRYWGNGYATESARKIVDWAFSKFGAHRVQASCWVKNAHSAGVLRNAGFRKEGILRGYLKRENVVRDEWMFGITRVDWKRMRQSSSSKK